MKALEKLLFNNYTLYITQPIEKRKLRSKLQQNTLEIYTGIGNFRNLLSLLLISLLYSRY